MLEYYLLQYCYDKMCSLFRRSGYLILSNTNEYITKLYIVATINSAELSYPTIVLVNLFILYILIHDDETLNLSRH